MPTHISIDVDQTILDDEGNLIVGVREGLSQLKQKGMTLQLWSKGGADRACETAAKFKLREFFTSYATKPDLAIDDLPEDAHPVCTLGVPFGDAVSSINQFVAESIETALCPGRDVVDLVRRIQACKNTFENTYGRILREGISLHPIPFFGNLESAQILTVGLNPSSTEFEPWREWPKAEIHPDILARRLASYFRSVRPRPHGWFGDYQEALAIIGGNYKVNAAHVDLIPWATLSPRKLAQNPDELELYNTMLNCGQTEWLPKVLKLCELRVKLVIIVDSFQDRADQTKRVCKKTLGTNWPGEIAEFRNVYKAKCWAWQNRAIWLQKLGGRILFD